MKLSSREKLDTMLAISIKLNQLKDMLDSMLRLDIINSETVVLMEREISNHQKLHDKFKTEFNHVT